MGLAQVRVSTHGRSTGGGGGWLEEQETCEALSSGSVSSSASALGQHHGLCGFLIYKMGEYIQGNLHLTQLWEESSEYPVREELEN